MSTPLCPPALPAYGHPAHAAPREGVRAFAPASIGNFAAGFDFLGAALVPWDGGLLGNVVEARRLPLEGPGRSAPGEVRFSQNGPYAPRLPREGNLVLQAHAAFREALEAQGGVMPPVALHLEANLAPSGGLGSSASSIVATLVALQGLLDHPLPLASLLACAGRVEGGVSGGMHLDNVGPCMLGGLRLIREEGLPATLPFPADLRIVVVHPGQELATREARAVLPRALDLGHAIAFARNASGLMQALHAGDHGDLAACLKDLVAEPHRAALVPGFREAQEAALAAGALGCSLSGAGPSCFAVVPSEKAPAVRRALESAFPEAQAGQARQAWICRLDAQGARVLSSWGAQEVPCA